MCVCEDRHGRVNQGCMDCRVEVRDVCKSGQIKNRKEKRWIRNEQVIGWG